MGPTRVHLALLLTAPLWSAESALQFTKTIGGSGNDAVTAMTTDPDGFVILAGATSALDFPVTNGTRNTGTQFAVTTDRGVTWQALSNLPTGAPAAIVADASKPPIWYAGGTAGVFKSKDGGAIW